MKKTRQWDDNYQHLQLGSPETRKNWTGIFFSPKILCFGRLNAPPRKSRRQKQIFVRLGHRGRIGGREFLRKKSTRAETEIWSFRCSAASNISLRNLFVSVVVVFFVVCENLGSDTGPRHFVLVWLPYSVSHAVYWGTFASPVSQLTGISAKYSSASTDTAQLQLSQEGHCWSRGLQLIRTCKWSRPSFEESAPSRRQLFLFWRQLNRTSFETASLFLFQDKK